MKNLLVSLTIVLLGATAFAKITTDVQALEKLKTYQDASVKSAANTTMSEDELKVQDAIYTSLRESVNVSIKSPKNEDLRQEVLRVTGLMLEKDPSQYAGDVVLPLYKFNKKSFLKSLEKLNKATAQEIQEAVKAAEKEEKEGNG